MNTYTTIPLAGNSFVTQSSKKGKERVSRSGWKNWTRKDTVFSVYVKLTATGNLIAALKFPSSECKGDLTCDINGIAYTAALFPSADENIVSFGEWCIEESGYIKVNISSASNAPFGKTFPHADSLLISGSAADGARGYVKPDDETNFYWTRRGPSVHCSYDISGADDDVEWFYNEVTVNPGEDPAGTYAMAIGFNGGYFGIQVNSESERRILFSIWSPYVTDDPQSIPEDKKTILAAKKDEVRAGQFGGEGSGGQSYLTYNWVSGQTYKFLMRIRPVAIDESYSNDTSNKTEFTAYFFFPDAAFPGQGKWELFASFIRPETHSFVERPHSFLENFSDINGFLRRKAHYTNQWAVTKNGNWFPVDTMTITADATAAAGNREDYTGGTENGGFYLTNGGFFNEFTPPKSKFTCAAHQKPEIDLTALVQSAEHENKYSKQ